MVTLLKMAGLILGVALVGSCAAVLSSEVPQLEPDPQTKSAAIETPQERVLQGSSPSVDSSAPGEVETATFALG